MSDLWASAYTRYSKKMIKGERNFQELQAQFVKKISPTITSLATILAFFYTPNMRLNGKAKALFQAPIT